ncbi:hydroxyisourate hydrolase [Rathayibacter iranicus]|uniref:5-hydroxyisourate hydrolase n=2 Tax=Rathayibacter iranicus TaxID=59737 RepID=A0AAD1ABX1_9MICO|nr:hydroxyisourate hydrolase [Rathayibacter iranicus]AZZ55382.1 hydroxyisourate hydrolase [Rathayibacter iranicus]MWV30886.1 hydroxyisourate hydrolase [Rathayibacter iranicus NCPPB 2253 = VKM Ac-1602]PPI48170.1 hydroxyisourate hydrolase [Rathayibacter iranicus]PPI61386.1 hydroxyisourate hydrolase [Rathayibacter iranicus]PPI72670.1 hydroxyisourate hydrolase [Rathayibacter iranicus]
MSGYASHVSTHVLDAVRGRPAQGVPVSLEARSGSDWERLAQARTDADGRVSAFGPERLSAGVYRVVFDTAAWFAAAGTESFYPEVVVVFRVDGVAAHLHVPLLLSPFAYSTYRGS